MAIKDGDLRSTRWFFNEGIYDALRRMGLQPELTRRVIIDLQEDNLPIIYVEMIGTKPLVDVVGAVAAMAGVRILK